MWSTIEIDGDWLAASKERLDKIEESQISEDRKRKEIAAAFIESVQSVLDDDLTEDFIAPVDKKKKVVQQEWPQILARDGYRKMNVKVMEVLMVLVSTYKVSENKAAACLQMVLNTLCGQSLLLPSPKEIEDDQEPSSSRKWTVGDLTQTLPSPQTIHNGIEDGAILSLCSR